MHASKTTLSKETKEILAKGLTGKQKRKLKVKRIKEYIRERPAGTIIEQKELAAAAGYDITVQNKLSTGYAFISRLVKKKVIVPHIEGNKRGASWSIPGDSKVIKPAKNSTADKDKPTENATTPPLRADSRFYPGRRSQGQGICLGPQFRQCSGVRGLLEARTLMTNRYEKRLVGPHV